MNQQQLRQFIADLHHVSHQLADIKYAMYGADGKKLESARDDLTALRVQLIEHLDEEY